MRLYLVSALTVATLVAALGAQRVQSESKASIFSQVRTLEKIKTAPRQEVCANRTREKWLDDILTRDCGRRYVTGGRIAGGYNASWGEFPSFVRLGAHTTKSYDLNYCGGTLIGPRHVLTAAHCVYPNMSAYTTILAEDKRPEVSFKVAKACKSRLYEAKRVPSESHHDVAILKLARPVQFTRYVQPACLPHKPIFGLRGLKAAGLGSTHYSNKTETFTRASRLQALPVRASYCPQYLAPEPKTKFCTYWEDPKYPGMTCFRDSGAPIYSWEDGRMAVSGLGSYGLADICEREPKEGNVNFDVFGGTCEVIKLLEECK